MKRIVFIFILITILITTNGSVIAQTTAFSNVTIIDVEEGVAKPDMTVVITGERIISVESENNTIIASGTKIIDATGKYMIPGLWDMHIHNVNDSIKPISWDFYMPEASETDQRKLYMPVNLAFGVTGIRELSGGLATLKLRKQILAGEILGPHMFIGSPVLDGPNPLFPDLQVIAIDGPESAKNIVTYLHEQGFDFIKTYSLLSAESYRALHERAGELGMEVSGHIPISVSVREAVELGHRSLEHMMGMELGCSSREQELRKKYLARLNTLNADPTKENRLDIWNRSEWEPYESMDPDRCRKLHKYLAENGTWVVPTLIFQHMVSGYDTPQLANNPNLKSYYPWLADLKVLADFFDPEHRLKKIHNYRMNIVGELENAGILILAGTDTSGGYTLHQELELLVKGGLSPVEALRTATINPARYLERENEIGTIESGKIADLVLLNANPLQDISNTQNIEAVMFQGHLLNRSKLDKMLLQLKKDAENWSD